VAAVFGRLGWRSFGGPAVHVALMRREVVQRRRWLGEAEFASLYAACNLLPGPGSTQLALLLGRRRAGWPGLALAAVLFIGPAVVVMLAVGELDRAVGTGTRVARALLGVEAAVVGVVARAALDLGGLVSRGARSVLLVAGAAVAGVAHLDPLLILGGALATGVVTGAAGRAGGRARTDPASRTPLALLTAPAHALSASGLLGLGLTFLKIGAVAFGSGYVLLPFLHDSMTGPPFGLSDHQIADAFAASQATPGPVFAVAAFLGDVAGGPAGGVLAAVAIFLPSLVYVPLINLVVRLVEHRPAVRAALDAVLAAVVGLVAAACVDLGRAAFRGGPEVLIAVVAFALLLRWPRAQPVAVVAGAAGGLALALVSP